MQVSKVICIAQLKADVTIWPVVSLVCERGWVCL